MKRNLSFFINLNQILLFIIVKLIFFIFKLIFILGLLNNFFFVLFSINAFMLFEIRTPNLLFFIARIYSNQSLSINKNKLISQLNIWLINILNNFILFSCFRNQSIKPREFSFIHNNTRQRTADHKTACKKTWPKEAFIN